MVNPMKSGNPILTIIFLLCLTCGCFAFGGTSHAASWYVDSSVSSSGNGTSWASAWKNVTNISGVAAGDTVYISGGPSASTQTYSLSSSWSPAGGTASAPITYKIGQDSSHNGTAIFSGSGTFLGGSLSNIAIVGDAGDGNMHFATSGFAVIAFMQGQVSNLRIGYVNFGQMAAAAGSWNVIEIYPLNRFEFDHNYLYVGPNANAFAYFSFNGSTWDDSKIHDNVIYLPNQDNGYGADGVESGGSVGFSIYNNQFIGYPTNYTGSQHQDGWQDTGGDSYVKIYNNTFISMGNSDIYLDGYYGAFAHTYVFNNVGFIGDTVIASGARYPFGIIVASNPGIISSFAFNDVIVANNLEADQVTESGIFIGPGAVTTSWTACGAYNNIDINNGAGGASITSGVANTDNVYFTAAQAASGLFVSYTTDSPNNNFHLLATATSLRGSGANLTSYCATVPELCKDKDGNARPSTGAWDIGPYQYVSATSIPPSAPQNLKIK